MSDRSKEFGEQLATVRPSTRHLITSVLLDQWPNLPAIVDFGIDSQQHYEALYFPIRNQEITPKDLDAAFGHGEKLTALVNGAISNPHKGVTFRTSWDFALGREMEQTKTAGMDSLREILSGKSDSQTPDAAKQKDREIER